MVFNAFRKMPGLYINQATTASLWSRFEPNTSSNLFGALLYNPVDKVRSPFASTFCDLLRNLCSSNQTLMARETLALAKVVPVFSKKKKKPLFRTFSRKIPRILQKAYIVVCSLRILPQTETPLSRSEDPQTAFRNVRCWLFVIPRSESRKRNRGPL